jgi:hypothetical protein
MGLLDSLVNVPERLRIWQQAGVRYFYLDPAAKPEPEPTADEQPDPADDPAHWPPLWAQLLHKAPVRPRLVITYLELGFDLTGRSDPRRSSLWRALIRDLHLAGKGLVAFWPLALPEGETLVPRPDIFGAGLRRLGPDRLAIFGPEAATALSLPGSAFETADLFDIPSCILPDPHTLLAGDKEVWAHVLTALSGDDAA